MAQVINTNIASLNSQRHLNNTQDTMRTAMERLSSGLRINSAKDDAAGLAISNRMTSQINGMDQAARNANDGISLAQTGEGSLQQMTNNLQRMRELAVQSRNATNTAQDRESLNSEFQQLLSENDRLAQTTAFNGRNILDGSLDTVEFQVGANVGETISVDVSSSMRTNSIGNHASADYKLSDVTGQTDAITASESFALDNSGDLEINGYDIGAAGGAPKATSFDITDITDGNTRVDTTNDTYALNINGTDIIASGNTIDNLESSGALQSADELAKTINQNTDTTGVSATADGDTITLKSVTDGDVNITETYNDTTSTDGSFTGITGTISGNGSNTSSVTFTPTSSGTGPTSALAIADAINESTDEHGVTATALGAEQTVSFQALSFNDGSSTDSLSYSLSINGETVTSQDQGSVNISSADALASQINGLSNKTGVTARVSNGDITLSTNDGRNINIREELSGASDGSSDTATGFFGTSLAGDASVSQSQYKGSVRLDSDSQITVEAADDGGADFASAIDDDISQTIANTESNVASTSALAASDVLNAANADSAIHRIDSALSDVDSLRGTFGAIQSRFESTVSSLETSSENLTSARSRIQDADFAAETAKLSKAQVLQQAGTSMLAQANQQPQSVLALLQ